MSDNPLPPGERPIPRAAILGAAALMAVAIAAAAVARVGGMGATVAEAPEAPPQAVRELVFADRDDGAVEVREAGDGGGVVVVLEPGTNGFVRGVMRGFARERRQHAINELPPFRLAREADGRLSLADTATGRRIELDAFGPDNKAAFARLLDDAAEGAGS